MAEDMIGRAQQALEKTRTYRFEDERERAIVILSEALDPEDEALVEAIAKRLAEDATAARNALRMIRQNIDLTNAPPVSTSIFKKDARLMLETLKQIAQGHPSSQEQVRASLSDTLEED